MWMADDGSGDSLSDVYFAVDDLIKAGDRDGHDLGAGGPSAS